MNDDGVKITKGPDGKVVVTATMDSHADAASFAREVVRKRRDTLSGLDKLIAIDKDLSPKIRESMVTIVRVLGIAFALILGLVVAITSGHAAVYIFPDAPMYDWLLFIMGALTVVGGVWAADEYMKLKRDETEDTEQRFRLLVFAAIAVFCLMFDVLGVVTTRVASSTGSLERLQDDRAKVDGLRKQIKLTQDEMMMVEMPAIPSAAYAARLESAMLEPTRTGKPVQTIGELMDICDVEVRDYCHEYQTKFSRIKYLQGEQLVAKSAEDRLPMLEAKLTALQQDLAETDVTNPNVVDEFFASGETPAEVERNTKQFRFWRTIVISVGQVLIFAVIVLILLDDRHAILARRRKAKQEEEVII